MFSTVVGLAAYFRYKDGAGLPLDSVKLLSPITHPDKVICIGMNYKDHCEEQNQPVPVTPVIFSKWGSVITGPYDDVVHPDNTTVSSVRSGGQTITIQSRMVNFSKFILKLFNDKIFIATVQ